MRVVRSILLLMALAGFAACSSSSSSTPGNPKVPAGAKSSGGLHATVETSQGTFQIEFFPNDAPKAVENFRLLAEHGYYEGTTFHRIVKGFMIQGGDPTGEGNGGESAWGGEFADEINPRSPLYQGGLYKRGILAMANRGPNTNGSQFFVMHDDYPLAPRYVIFARITGGFEAVDAIANVQTTIGRDGAMSKPVTPVVIKKVTIQP